MNSPRRLLLNIILPSVILFVLISFMVGCIYIPTFDHTILDGTKKDFRGWAGKQKNIPPQKLAAFTRSQIESLFGKPAFASHNTQCVAYVMGSESDILLMPLCFGGWVNGQTHILKMVYDDDNHLKRVVPIDEPRTVPFYVLGSDLGKMNDSHAEDPLHTAFYLLNDINESCSKDEVIDDPGLWRFRQKSRGLK